MSDSKTLHDLNNELVKIKSLFKLKEKSLLENSEVDEELSKVLLRISTFFENSSKIS